VIVEVVAEELDVRDGGRCDGGIGEMAREKDEGDISNVFRIAETRQVANLEGRFTVGV